MFGSIGVPELLIILVIALVIFGPKKLPEIGKTLGKTLRDFKSASNEVVNTVQEEPQPQKIEKPIEATVVETKTEALEKTEQPEEK